MYLNDIKNNENNNSKLFTQKNLNLNFKKNKSLIRV